MKSLRMIMLVLCAAINCIAQSLPAKLIPPNGKYPIGTVVYEWADETRDLAITNNIGDRRTVIVQIWYPAMTDSNSVPAPYSALSADYRNIETNGFLRPSFAKDLSPSKLILIVPGRGTERFLYTTIAEELASRGFTVASIDMPEIGYTIYQDGLILKPSKEFETPPGMMAGPYEKVDAFFEKPTAIGYMDLKFALDRIRALNENDPDKRFTGRIDLLNIGIFGHSLGGRIAGEFAARNTNVKALAAMEGIAPRDVRYNGKISVPQLMLCSSGTLPYAVDNYMSLVDNRKNIVYMAELVDFGHNSVTDNPYLFPGKYKYRIDPQKGLEISRRLLANFFDAYLRHDGDFQKADLVSETVKITKYN
ncbi:MAG: hypothetical protein KDB79_07290 [Acidobacteria bacterium]|nr:hypothetical protein [Acidobacteriota bacterium]